MTHPLYIAFVWHMHQPYYRNRHTGECRMPWVRLHGTKDYLDMVALLGSFPTIHQTFNLVPSLLDQLEEYLPPANQSDRFLELSRKPAEALSEEDRRFLLEHFFMANWDQMVKPHARYYDLLAKRGNPLDEAGWTEAVKRFRPQDYLDLQVWFNLVWIDPWLRQQDEHLRRLEGKGSQFTEEEKRLVLGKQLDILARVVPAYRDAQQRGQVELTTSPYYHPIVPLLCDLRAAQAALPQLPIPEAGFRHPDDARWHLTQALERHARTFGQRPQGLWPPEGGVSEDLVRLAIEGGVRWIATDEEILWRTLKTSRAPSLLYRPHLIHRKQGNLAVVFRDRELSDLIGFVYSQWPAGAAIQDFMSRLTSIEQQFRAEKTPALVSIVLDGENAWEFYHRDGHDFLRGMYEALAGDERFRLVTVTEFLDRFPLDQTPSLPDLFAGSWIDGNFATWIGHPEKNAAWAHLAKAREDLAAASASASEEARRNFAIAEGSDWMWWYGDTHSSAQDEEFDALFRTHLANMYRALGQEPPEALALPIKTRVIHPACEPTALMTPVLDGVETTYYEWLYAGRIDLRKSYGAIHRSQQALQTLYYGFDRASYYFRVDLSGLDLRAQEGGRLEVEFPDRDLRIIVQPDGAGGVMAQAHGTPPHVLACGYQRTLEVAVPKARLPVKAGEAFQLRLTLLKGADVLERYPAQGVFRVTIPAADFETRLWSV